MRRTTHLLAAAPVALLGIALTAPAAGAVERPAATTPVASDVFGSLGDPAALAQALGGQPDAAGVRTRFEPRLETALRADSGLAAKVTGYGVRQDGTFTVRVADAGDTATRDRLTALLPAGFEVEEAPDATQPLDDPLGNVGNRSFDLGVGGHNAGAQLWMVGDNLSLGTCTIGYGYRWQGQDYMVTAGHCAPRGGGRSVMLAGLNVDANPDSRLDLQVRGGQDDLAVARMDMGDGMYETGSKQARTRLDGYQRDGLEGKTVCHSGARTQGSCGWKVEAGGKQKVAFTIPDKDGVPQRVYLEVYVTSAPAGTRGDHGDSGGPVYIQQDDGRKILVGSLTGGGYSRSQRTKYMFFTGVDAALDAMPGGHPIVASEH